MCIEVSKSAGSQQVLNCAPSEHSAKCPTGPLLRLADLMKFRSLLGWAVKGNHTCSPLKPTASAWCQVSSQCLPERYSTWTWNLATVEYTLKPLKYNRSSLHYGCATGWWAEWYQPSNQGNFVLFTLLLYSTIIIIIIVRFIIYLICCTSMSASLHITDIRDTDLSGRPRGSSSSRIWRAATLIHHHHHHQREEAAHLCLLAWFQIEAYCNCRKTFISCLHLSCCSRHQPVREACSMNRGGKRGEP